MREGSELCDDSNGDGVDLAGETCASQVGAGATGTRMLRFRMDPEHSDRIEIQMSFDQKLIAADLGYFFLDAVS